MAIMCYINYVGKLNTDKHKLHFTIMTDTPMTTKNIRTLPDYNYLHEKFFIDSYTGTLRRKTTGKIAGSPNKDGYQVVMIDRTKFYVHRIAYLMFFGRDPGKSIIDHCDGNKQNNGRNNLRAVDNSFNLLNTEKSRGPQTRWDKAKYELNKELEYWRDVPREVWPSHLQPLASFYNF